MPAQPEPNAVDTAALPIVDGPELVRPYVPAPAFEPEPQHAVAVGDAAATQLIPPVPAAPPAVEPQAMTMTMPPVPPAHPAPPAFAPEAPDEQEPELGLFDFHGTSEHRAGGRAERRAQQQSEDSRRRALIIGAGVGIAAVGAGLALLVSPSDSGNGKADQALPTVTGSLWDPSPGDPSPSGEPSSAGSATSSEAPKPTPSHTVTKAPATTAKPAPTTVSSAPAPPPPATPTFRTLKPGDKGPDVGQMQQLLLTVCFDQQITNTFDQQTEQNIVKYQHMNHIRGEDGVYGPQTRAQLTNDAANPNC